MAFYQRIPEPDRSGVQAYMPWGEANDGASVIRVERERPSDSYAQLTLAHRFHENGVLCIALRPSVMRVLAGALLNAADDLEGVKP